MSDTTVSTSFWAASMQAAERSFLSGETQTAVAQLVHASWVAACTGERVPKSTADRLKHNVLRAAGIESPESAA